MDTILENLANILTIIGVSFGIYTYSMWRRNYQSQKVQDDIDSLVKKIIKFKLSLLNVRNFGSIKITDIGKFPASIWSQAIPIVIYFYLYYFAERKNGNIDDHNSYYYKTFIIFMKNHKIDELFDILLEKLKKLEICNNGNIILPADDHKTMIDWLNHVENNPYHESYYDKKKKSLENLKQDYDELCVEMELFLTIYAKKFKLDKINKYFNEYKKCMELFFSASEDYIEYALSKTENLITNNLKYKINKLIYALNIITETDKDDFGKMFIVKTTSLESSIKNLF